MHVSVLNINDSEKLPKSIDTLIMKRVNLLSSIMLRIQFEHFYSF